MVLVTSQVDDWVVTLHGINVIFKHAANYSERAIVRQIELVLRVYRPKLVGCHQRVPHFLLPRRPSTQDTLDAQETNPIAQAGTLWRGANFSKSRFLGYTPLARPAGSIWHSVKIRLSNALELAKFPTLRGETRYLRTSNRTSLNQPW